MREGDPSADSGELRSWIERARAGDADAFERLYEQFERSIFSLCYHLLGDADAAADAAQEAFVGAWARMGRLRHPAAFSAWLRAAAVNACRHRRRKGRWQTTFSEAFADRPPEEMIEETAPAPDQRLATDELTAEVRRALEQLSPDHREVVVMHHLEGLALVDIAAAQGVAVGTVKSRLNRARAKLETILRPYLEPPETTDG